VTRRFWHALMIFAYRRLRANVGKIPDGVPMIRSADARCSGFEPRRRQPGDFDCSGDGHYLCTECCHRTRCEECGAISASDSDEYNPLCEACAGRLDEAAESLGRRT
jgi:hypothetical protein